MIKIYGNQVCIYCLRAKRLAESRNFDYEWFDTDEPENMAWLKEHLPNSKTIPQIWWHDRHVGGYEEFATEVENTIISFGEGKL